MKHSIQHIIKRNGDKVDLDPQKIISAISKAVDETAEFDLDEVHRLADIAITLTGTSFKPEETPTVEQISDIVEQVLMAAGHYQTAKAFILYREQHRKDRAARAVIGVTDDLGLSINQLKVIERRYLLHDEDGKVIETPRQLFERVARTLANVEPKAKKHWQQQFFEVMSNLEFLPAGRTLNNAGTKQNQLANCFVLPITDSMEGIFDAVKWTALVHQTGGGCIVKGSKIFTTSNGLENFEDLYNRCLLTSHAHQVDKNSFRIDIRENIQTISFVPTKGTFTQDKVNSIWKYQLDPKIIRTIELEGHLKLITSDWHPFYVFSDSGVVQKRADEIQTGDYLITTNSSIVDSKTWLFNTIQKFQNQPIDAEIGWLVGYILGDGSFGQAKTTTKEKTYYKRLRLFDGRIESLNYAAKILSRLTGETYHVQKDLRSKTLCLTTTHQQIVSWLKDLTQITGPKNDSLKIPSIITQSPPEVIAALLAGLVDSDGHITKSRNRMEYATESHQLAEQISSLLNMFGINTSIRSRKPKNPKWKLMWEVRVDGGNELNKLNLTLGKYLHDVIKKDRLALHSQSRANRFGHKSPITWNILEPYLIKAGIKTISTSIHRQPQKVGTKSFWLHRLKWGLGISTNELLGLIDELMGLPFFTDDERFQLSLLKWNNSSIRPVTHISVGSDITEFYDFTTQTHHNYLAGINGLATIHNTGFNFSKLRPNGDVVSKSSGGFATGPVSFMKVFDVATRQVMQGGKKRGANMGILNVDHPDIIEFITCKTEDGEIANFNISVGITDEFVKAVKADKDFALRNPRTGEPVQILRASTLMDQIATLAWRTGDPGMIYLDAINRNNPLLDKYGRIDSTNPCGEQPLHPFDACNLGSINLAKFILNESANQRTNEPPINWSRLREVTHIAVRMLDNVIDSGTYPLPQIADTVKANRRIGLGIMGWADMLYQLHIPYDSDEGVNLAKKVMKFIQTESWLASEQLAQEKGVFPRWSESSFKKLGKKVRNVAITTIAPTGTISMVADCSSGIEPAFALAYVKNVVDDAGLSYVNPYFSQELHHLLGTNGEYNQAVSQISQTGSCQHLQDLPDTAKRVFVTAHDIHWQWHIKMQAAFQKYVDNAVSKTINLPNSASIEDVKAAYLLSWELGCKGVTVYRDGSKDFQVLQTADHQTKKPANSKIIIQSITKQKTLKQRSAEASHKTQVCPECGEKTTLGEGCVLCHACGWSACSA